MRCSQAFSQHPEVDSGRSRAVVTAVALLCAVTAIAFAPPRATGEVARGSGVARHLPRSAETLSASPSPFVNGAGAVTLVGTGAAGFAGDGGAARSAELNGPGGIAEDRNGDLFIADSDNCRVREIPSVGGIHYSLPMVAGHVYTIAGGPCSATGESTSSSGGTVGFATSLAVDSSGDVFVADATGNMIFELPSASGEQFGRFVSAGKLTVVAGTGSAGDSGNGQVASSAELNDPGGVGVDPSGDLYIADTGNCEVREVVSRNGTHFGIQMAAGHIYTIAGTGTCGEKGDGGPANRAELWDPVGIEVGPAGDLVVSDGGGEEILDLPPVSGTFYGVHIAANHLSVVAGIGFYGPYLIDGLPATGQTAELNSPAGIALDAGGDLFIADTYSSCIREVPARNVVQRGMMLTGGDMYTVAGALKSDLGGSTTWTGPQMLYPVGVAMAPDGAVVYSDQGANVVREVSPT